jgi:hypothetical protein
MHNSILPNATRSYLAVLATSIGATIVLTFCAPQPAHAGYLEHSSCDKVVRAVSAVLDDTVSIKDSNDIASTLNSNEDDLVVSITTNALRFGIPLPSALAVARAYCLHKATL